MVTQVVSEYCPRKVKCLTLPDAPVISGTSHEIFAYYGLDTYGIVNTVKEMAKCAMSLP